MRAPLALVPCLLSVLAAQELAFPDNSTRKERVPPSAVAARCGSQISWAKDWETALAAAQATKKPIFWYVATVAGSPMDRKPEIDRCMRGGPLSCPEIVAFVNEHCVPLAVVPKGKLQKELGLVREVFIEPGFVLLDATGKVKTSLDKLSTFHYPWLLAWLERNVGAKATPRAVPEPLATARAKLAAGASQEALAALDGEALAKAPPAVRAEGAFLRGAIQMRTGHSNAARATWAAAAKELPDEPFAWKCAMEAEGHGPFWRGFEELRALPDAALGAKPEGTQAPAGLYDEATIRTRCTEYLIAMQRENGGYDDSIYDFGGSDGLPNVWTATSAIVGLALLEAHPAADDKAVEATLARITAYVGDDKNIATTDADEQLWAHVYRARFFARLCDLRPPQKDTAKEHLAAAAKAILRMQLGSGAWYHEYPNPFVSASALLALKEAEKHGIALDKARIDKGILALLSCRAEQTGAFSYGQDKPKKSMPVVGAAGRMPLCENALFAFGASGKDKLQAALTAAFANHQQLESTRKYDNHANKYAYGGFFFWYDVQERVEAILALPDSEARKELVKKQREQILAIVEIDGCFVDSHELGKSYGTAMGLLCLARLGG